MTSLPSKVLEVNLWQLGARRDGGWEMKRVRIWLIANMADERWRSLDRRWDRRWGRREVRTVVECWSWQIHNLGYCFWRILRRHVEIIPEFPQFYMPGLPFSLRRIQGVSHVAQKLNLHDVNLLNRYARYLGPRLVRIGVIIED